MADGQGCGERGTVQPAPCHGLGVKDGSLQPLSPGSHKEPLGSLSPISFWWGTPELSSSVWGQLIGLPVSRPS